MCLEKVDKITKKGTGIGYKVFARDGVGGIKPTDSEITRYKLNRWYKDKRTLPIKTRGNHYPTGYHIFVNKEDALILNNEIRTARRVKYSDVVASGTQDTTKSWGTRVIVARKMYIYPKKEL